METYERLRQMLAVDYKLQPEKLLPEARLDELGIDSLGVMELLFKVEEEFHIRVPSEQADLGTIGDVVNYIERLVREQGGQGTQSASGAATGTTA